MTISLMTLNIVGEMFFKFQMDQDFEGFTETYEEMMDLAKECGYTSVDVTTLETMAFTAKGVKERLDARGLKAGSFIYMANLAAVDEEGYDKRVQDAKAAVDTALLFGTDILMLAPQAHEGIENNTPEEIRDSLVKHLMPVVSYAKEKKVHVVVEDTPDLRLHFCSMEDVKAVLDRVPGLEMVYDSGNMILVKEDPVTYFRTFRDKIAHVHIKDMQEADPKAFLADHDVDGRAMTGAPTGTGLIDLDAVMAAMRETEYDGGVTIEFVVDEAKDYRGTLIRSREFVENRSK